MDVGRCEERVSTDFRVIEREYLVGRRHAEMNAGEHGWDRCQHPEIQQDKTKRYPAETRHHLWVEPRDIYKDSIPTAVVSELRTRIELTEKGRSGLHAVEANLDLLNSVTESNPPILYYFRIYCVRGE